jgi:hypothetical protein
MSQLKIDRGLKIMAGMFAVVLALDLLNGVQVWTHGFVKVGGWVWAYFESIDWAR